MTHNGTAPLRVLLVDDHPAMAELMTDDLEAEDDRFVVDAVTSVEEALTHLDEAEYECLVSDYEMPTMTGIEFLEVVRERYSDLPFILVTEGGSEEVASDAISAGVTDYFRKESGDVRETALANRIANAVERRRARRGRQAMRERMELALEVTDSVAFEVDFGTDAVRQHGAFEEFFGVASAEVPTLEEYAHRVVHPSDRDGFLDFVSRLRNGDRESDTCEYRTHPDLGEERWIRARARVRGDADGGRHAIGLAQDVTAQKERVRELELKDRAIDEAPVGVTITDPDREDNPLIYVNEQFVQLTGYDESEILGCNCRFLQGEGTDPETVAQIRDAIQDGRSVSVELRNYRKDGTEFWNRVTIAPVRDENGEISNFVGFQEDVTERREHEQELRRLSQEYQAVFDNAQDSLFLVDVDRSNGDSTFLFRHLNPANRAALGLEDAQVQGKTPREVFGEDVGSELRANYERCLEAGETIRYEEELSSVGDSETRVFETTLSPVELEGEQRQIVGVAHDITERKERLEKLQWYEGIVETTGDTAAVIDEDGRFKIVNGRLAEIYGTSPDQLIGEQSRLVATLADRYEDTDPYRELVEGDREEFRAELKLSSPSHGNRISDVRMTRLTDDGTFRGIVAVGRDISERKEYERRLAALNESTNEFAGATTTAEATEYIVTAMADAAGLPNAVVYIYDDEEGVLTPAAQSEDAVQLLGTTPSIGPGEGVAWQAFASGETVRYDDIREADAVYNPQTPIRSELIVPLGEHGVLVASDPQPGVFDDRNQEFAEIIAAAAEAALDSVTQTERLRERTRELDRRTRRLDRINQLNDAIRCINRAIVDADSREMIVETVCGQIAELDHVEFAWIGEPSPDPGTLSLWTWNGTDRSYLDMREFPVDEESDSDPARDAARTGEIAHVPNIVRADDTGQWQTAALQQGYKSVLSVPLLYENSLYGVLTIYAGTQDVFDEAFRKVLAELGDLVALGLNALDRRDALLGRRQTSVELTVAAESAGEDPFLQLAHRLDCTVEVSRILPRDETSLVYAACTDVTEREVVETVDQISGIASVRRVRGTDPCETEPCLFEFLAPAPGLMLQLADRGVRYHTITFERGRARIVATVPSTVDPSTLVRDLESHWPDLVLEGSEIQREQTDVSNAFLLTDDLTAAQQEAIEAAYEAGFFEWPRDSTSEEVASALGISQPAFAQRLRAAQAKVFKAYCQAAATKRAESNLHEDRSNA